jgi:hypothetical protein
MYSNALFGRFRAAAPAAPRATGNGARYLGQDQVAPLDAVCERAAVEPKEADRHVADDRDLRHRKRKRVPVLRKAPNETLRTPRAPRSAPQLAPTRRARDCAAHRRARNLAHRRAGGRARGGGYNTKHGRENIRRAGGSDLVLGVVIDDAGGGLQDKGEQAAAGARARDPTHDDLGDPRGAPRDVVEVESLYCLDVVHVAHLAGDAGASAPPGGAALTPAEETETCVAERVPVKVTQPLA